MDITLNDVLAWMAQLGYQVDKRPYKLNLVGIRDKSIAVPENYSDHIAYFYWDDNGNLNGKVAEATTTPGIQYLYNPISGSSGGTAILKQGQYVDTWGIGIHRGKYDALTQQKPVTVIRDNDRNSELNYFASTTTGLYGINIHRSTATYASKDLIGPDSAGCQVFRWVDDFNEMMDLARKSRDLYGNAFTYTLIDQREQLQEERKTIINYAVIGGTLIALTGYFYYLYKKKVIKL